MSSFFDLISNLKRLFFNIISPNPNYLIIYVTTRCNSKCVTCCNWQRIAQHNLSKELTLKEFYNIASNLPNLEYLNVSGGEPLLRKDLKQIIHIFIRVSKVQIVTLPTNGTLPQVLFEQISWLLKHHPKVIFNVNLSLDAFGEKHDELRGFPNNFKLVLESYKLLTGLKKVFPNLSIQTSTVISKFNQEDVLDTVKAIRSNLEIDNPTIGLVRGVPRLNESLQVSPKRYINLIRYTQQELFTQMKKDHNLYKNLLRSVKILAWSIIAETYVRKKLPINCTAGRKMLIIDELSNVYPCEILTEKFGNLRENGFRLNQILAQSQSKQLLKNISNHKCNCTYECSIQNSLVNNPKYYIFILKNLLRGVFK